MRYAKVQTTVPVQLEVTMSTSFSATYLQWTCQKILNILYSNTSTTVALWMSKDAPHTSVCWVWSWGQEVISFAQHEQWKTEEKAELALSKVQNTPTDTSEGPDTAASLALVVSVCPTQLALVSPCWWLFSQLSMLNRQQSPWVRKITMINCSAEGISARERETENEKWKVPPACRHSIPWFHLFNVFFFLTSANLNFFIILNSSWCA